MSKRRKRHDPEQTLKKLKSRDANCKGQRMMMMMICSSDDERLLLVRSQEEGHAPCGQVELHIA